MSRIGKKRIIIPPDVIVSVDGDIVAVKGPKGELRRVLNKKVHVKVEGERVVVDVDNKEEKKERALWGTFAAHIGNMVIGVTKGYKRQLEINGVGYRAALQGKDLKLEVGFSHSVIYQTPENVSVALEKNLITVEGADKELVGQAAAEIRAIRKPEPYKGKGIKYLDEVIRRKAGKSAVKSAS